MNQCSFYLLFCLSVVWAHMLPYTHASVLVHSYVQAHKYSLNVKYVPAKVLTVAFQSDIKNTSA